MTVCFRNLDYYFMSYSIWILKSVYGRGKCLVFEVMFFMIYCMVYKGWCGIYVKMFRVDFLSILWYRKKNAYKILYIKLNFLSQYIKKPHVRFSMKFMGFLSFWHPLLFKKYGKIGKFPHKIKKCDIIELSYGTGQKIKFPGLIAL